MADRPSLHRFHVVDTSETEPGKRHVGTCVAPSADEARRLVAAATGRDLSSADIEVQEAGQISGRRRP